MKNKELQQDVDKLVLLGKRKGFLTYDEVNSTLSNTVDSSEEIDQVFEILDGKDIKIIESEDEESDVENNEIVRSAQHIHHLFDAIPFKVVAMLRIRRASQ